MSLYVPFPEYNLQKNMFYRGARLWNALPGYWK